MAFETRIARRVSLAVERRQTSTWIRRGGRTRLRGIPAWTVMALLGVIALTPIVASATSPPVFTLGGTAFRTVDPTNAANFVISMDTAAPGSFGFATRSMNVPISSLTSFLSVDYYLAARDCGGGSPRISLSVDVTGDGIRDGAAFGYVGTSPSFTGCAVNAWQSADLTDSGSRWDLTQFGGAFYNTWSEALTFFAGMPFSTVVRGSLVDDSAWMPGAAGLAYYDNLVMGDHVLSGPGDVSSSEAPVHLDVGSDHIIDADYGTIQAAVNAAAPTGDTVLVDAGAYPELVTIAKSVTLMGAEAGTSGCGRVSAPESVVGTPSGAFQILADNVVIDGFTIAGVDGSSGISSLGAGIWTTGTNSGHVIRNNILTGNTMGVYLNSDGRFSSVVERNQFTSNNVAGGAAGNGIYSDQGANDVTIRNNCFTGQDNAAMVFAGGSPGSGTTQSHIAVRDNVFLNDAGGTVFFFASDLAISGNSWTNSGGTSVYLGGNVHDVMITGNTFQAAAYRGIKLHAGDFGDTDLDTNVVARFNNFINNGAEGLLVDLNSYSGTLVATCNWWGSTSGPTTATNPAGTGDELVALSGTVSFAPWLGSPTPNPCSGPVHLDIASNGPGVDMNFGTIQPAVSAAHDGDTIVVDAGTYPELVVVDKSLSFLGAQSAVNPCGGRPGPESIVGSANGAFVLFANHITIDGFTVAGVTGGYTAGIYTSGAFSGYDIRNNIVRDNVFGLYFNSNGVFASRAGSNFFLDNNNPGAASGNGIYSDQGAHLVDVVNNCFVGNLNTAMLFVGGAGGTTTSQSDLTITGNEADNSIALVVTDRGTIADNRVILDPAIAGSGIFLGGGVTNVIIARNLVEHSPYSGIKATVDPLNFGVSAPNTDLTVDTNVLHDNVFGVNLFEVQNVLVVHNTITGSATSVRVIDSANIHALANTIMGPDSHGLDAVIGVEVAGSTAVEVRGSTIDFLGFVGGVSTLYGVSYDASSGSILGNSIFDVRMGPLSFGAQTGIGVVVSGTSVVDIVGNTILRYQKGGIVVGRFANGFGNDPVVAYIADNTVVGVGPTNLIAQNGIQVADTASAIVFRNYVAGNMYTGGFWTATGILAYSAASGIQVLANTLVDNQAGVYLFDSVNGQVESNTVSGGALGIVADTSNNAYVWANALSSPTVVQNEPEVIGIWVIDSAGVTAFQNSIDFGGAVGVVATLRGISFVDSSGTIRGNTVRGVRMAGSDFSRLTGIGISAVGSGDLLIADNTVRNYQWGGIFIGLPDSPYTGHVDILNNLVRGVGPTRLIRQIGVLLVGPGVTGSVGGNFIADNCFIAGRNGNNHDDDNEHGNHDRDGRDRDDDNDNHGDSRCRGNSEVSNGDRRTCPPGVAVGLLLCNVNRDTLDVSRNRFSGNQVDILQVRT